MKMKVVLELMFGLACTVQAAEQYADRWFYVSRGMGHDRAVEEIKSLVDVAAKNGLNGMLLACGVESYNFWDEKSRARLAAVKQACDAAKVEIIPIIWSVGKARIVVCLVTTAYWLAMVGAEPSVG